MDAVGVLQSPSPWWPWFLRSKLFIDLETAPAPQLLPRAAGLSAAAVTCAVTPGILWLFVPGSVPAGQRSLGFVGAGG